MFDGQTKVRWRSKHAVNWCLSTPDRVDWASVAEWTIAGHPVQEAVRYGWVDAQECFDADA